MNLEKVPDGLSERAREFVRAHGTWVDCAAVEKWRERWLAHGIPAEQIDRVAAFEERWGGLRFPLPPVYEGPVYLEGDVPEGSEEEGWWFGAGDQRTAVPYSFMISPTGEFGIHCWDKWVPLHATVEGWVESVALAHYAAGAAKKVTRRRGPRATKISLAAYEPVPEVKGMADTWWRGENSLVAIYTGDARAFSMPRDCRTFVYSGL